MGISDFILKGIEQKKADKEDRKKQFLVYLPKLLDQGLNIDEVNAMMRKYVEGISDLQLPTKRTVKVSDELTPKQNRQFLKGQGPEFLQDIPGGPTTQKDIELNQPFIDPTTGVVTYAPRGTKVAKPNVPKTPKTLKDYQDDIAANVLKNYFVLEATGQDTATILPSANNAARRLGMSIEKIKTDPTMWEKLRSRWTGGEAEGETIEKPTFNTKPPQIPAPGGNGKKPTKITSRAEYDRYPSGTLLDWNGKVFTKQ
jgi:hypothetical protein